MRSSDIAKRLGRVDSFAIVRCRIEMDDDILIRFEERDASYVAGCPVLLPTSIRAVVTC